MESSYPPDLTNPALRAIYDNLEAAPPPLMHDPEVDFVVDSENRTARVIAVDDAIRRIKKADWRGNRFKEREVRNAIISELGGDPGLIEKIFELVKNQRDY